MQNHQCRLNFVDSITAFNEELLHYNRHCVQGIWVQPDLGFRDLLSSERNTQHMDDNNVRQYHAEEERTHSSGNECGKMEVKVPLNCPNIQQWKNVVCEFSSKFFCLK